MVYYYFFKPCFFLTMVFADPAPNASSTVLPTRPNSLSGTCGSELAWLRTFFTLFLSLTFPLLWTGPHLSRFLRHLLGRDSEVSAPGNQHKQLGYNTQWQLVSYLAYLLQNMLSSWKSWHNWHCYAPYSMASVGTGSRCFLLLFLWFEHNQDYPDLGIIKKSISWYTSYFL